MAALTNQTNGNYQRIHERKATVPGINGILGAAGASYTASAEKDSHVEGKLKHFLQLVLDFLLPFRMCGCHHRLLASSNAASDGWPIIAFVWQLWDREAVYILLLQDSIPRGAFLVYSSYLLAVPHFPTEGKCGPPVRDGEQGIVQVNPCPWRFQLRESHSFQPME